MGGGCGAVANLGDPAKRVNPCAVGDQLPRLYEWSRKLRKTNMGALGEKSATRSPG